MAILQETMRRMGIAPMAAGGITAGGAVLDSRAIALLETIAANLARPNVSFVNPVSKDAKSDAWEAAQILDV
ncbi:hypothetical protein D3C87_2051440 [compost metagenome]